MAPDRVRQWRAQEEDPNLDTEESRASGHKGGDNNQYDSIAQNEEGTGTNGGNSTASTEYASVISGARSSVDPKVSSVTYVTDGAKVEGGECHHGNNGSANSMGAKEVPGAK